MSTKIRLSRGGAKKRPYYSIVVTSSRSPRDSKIIEKIGIYNPLLPKDSKERVKFDSERMAHWMKVGAQPSEVVTRLLRNAGVITSKPVYRGKPKTSKKAKGDAAAAPAA